MSEETLKPPSFLEERKERIEELERVIDEAAAKLDRGLEDGRRGHSISLFVSVETVIIKLREML